MDSDGLRQNSFHWQVEGGQSSASHGGGWGPWGPPELAPDSCQAAPSALGRV